MYSSSLPSILFPKKFALAIYLLPEQVDDVKRRLQDATRGAAEVGDDEYAPED